MGTDAAVLRTCKAAVESRAISPVVLNITARPKATNENQLKITLVHLFILRHWYTR